MLLILEWATDLQCYYVQLKLEELKVFIIHNEVEHGMKIKDK